MPRSPSGRRARARLVAPLLAVALVAGACTEPGATGAPSPSPASASPAASGDSPFPSGDACSIATACPSPTE